MCLSCSDMRVGAGRKVRFLERSRWRQYSGCRRKWAVRLDRGNHEQLIVTADGPPRPGSVSVNPCSLLFPSNDLF